MKLASLLYSLIVAGLASLVVAPAHAQAPRPRPRAEILNGKWTFPEARPAA